MEDSTIRAFCQATAEYHEYNWDACSICEVAAQVYMADHLISTAQAAWET